MCDYFGFVCVCGGEIVRGEKGGNSSSQVCVLVRGFLGAGNMGRFVAVVWERTVDCASSVAAWDLKVDWRGFEATLQNRKRGLK
jgi:hypothetical protein